MNIARIGQIFDGIISGSRDSSALQEFVPELSGQELSEVLSVIREHVLDSDDIATLASWTRLTANLLLSWAVSSHLTSESSPARADIAGKVAAAASDIFRNDLMDSDSAEIARIAASILSLNPRGMAAVYDRYSTGLDDQTRIRMLKLLAGSGDPDFNAKYGPELAGALAASRRKAERDALVAKAKTGLHKGKSHDKLEDSVLLLQESLTVAPADDELRALYVQAMSEPSHFDDAQKFLMSLAVGLEGTQRALVLIDAAAFQLKAGNLDAATETMETALEADRTNETACDRYLDTLRNAGKLDRAVSFFESLRRDAAGAQGEPSILKWQGRVLMELGRDDESEKVWRRLRAVDPRSIDALEFYVWYHGRKEDWQKQFATLQFELSIVESDAERIRINQVMAGVAENRLNNLDRAAEAQKRILAIAPDDDAAFEALVALLEKSAKWHALVEFYNDRIRRLPADDIEQKVSLLFRIVEIYQHPDKQPSQESMLAAYARIVEISPSNTQALDTLARGYESSERWPDLLKVLQKKVDVTEEPAELLELFHRISEIAINRMSNETQAIPFLEKMLEIDPQNLDVVKKLKNIYKHKHNQEKLYVMLRRELDMVTGHDREQALLSAASMARDRLLRHDEALSLYEEAYRLNGTLREARENMHHLYTRLERWKDYAAFLASEIECPMPLKRRIELLHKLGEIYVDRMGDVQQAGLIYNRILELDGGDDVASRRLEQIYIDREDFDAVYALYKRRNDIRRFVAVLGQREAKEDAPGMRKALNLILAKAFEDDLGEPSRALDCLEAAFLADSSDSAIGKRVMSLATSRKDNERLERTLKTLAGTDADVSERQFSYLALHKMYSESGRPGDAFDAVASAIRLDIKSSELPRLILVARRTASEAGLWQPLAELLEEIVLEVEDAAWRKDLLMELGSVYWDRLLFHQEARSAFERVLDIDPDTEKALDLLESIALQQEDYTALEHVLIRRLDSSHSPEAKKDIYMRLGGLYEDLLGDDTQAADSYSAAVNASAEPDKAALAGLHRTLERSERFLELADVIRKERELAVTDWDRTRLDCELAVVLSDNLEQTEEALDILEEVLANGESPAALAQVSKIFSSGRDTDKAGRILQAQYRGGKNSAELISVIEVRLERTGSREVKAGLLVEAGNLKFGEFQDAAGAFDDFLGSVELYPTDENVTGLMKLVELTGRYAETAAVFGRWVGIAEGKPRETGGDESLDPALEARLSRLLGELYGQKLAEPALAVRAMEKALPFEGGDPEFLAELLMLYKAVGDVDSAMSMFDRLADAQSGGDRRQTLIEKALFASAHGMVDQAILTVRNVSAEGYDPDADTMLEDMLYEHGRFFELISHLEHKASIPQHAADAPDINFKIAVIYREQMNLPREAARYIAMAILATTDREDLLVFAENLANDHSLNGRDDFVPALLDVLERSFRGRDEYSDRLVAVLRNRARLSGSPESCVEMLSDIADIEAGRGNLVASFETLAQALATVPSSDELLEKLVAAGIAAGVPDKLIESLKLISQEAPDDARVPLLMASAAVAAKHLNDHERAVAIYRDLNRMYPGNILILKALDSELSGLNQDSSRIALLQEMADLAVSLDDKREIRLDAAELAMRAGEYAAAAEALTFVVESRPDEEAVDGLAAEASTMLIEAAEKLDDAGLKTSTHLLLGRYLEDQSRRRGHLVTAATIIRDDLGDQPRALLVFLEVLAGYPGDATARNAARALAREIDDIAVLLKLLGDDLDLAEDEFARNDALVEMARVYARPDIHDPQASLGAIKKIMATDPRHQPALDVAVGFFDDPDFAVEAARIVEDAAEATENKPLLVDALNVLVRHETASRKKISILKRIGKSCVELGRHAEAIAAFGAAFVETPLVEDSFIALYDELARQQKHELVVEWVRRACNENAADADDRNTVRLRAAHRLSEFGQRLTEAVTLLDDGLAEKGDDKGVITAMCDLALRLNDHERYVRTLRLKIAHVLERSDDRADAWLDCAAVYTKNLNDPASAESCYREALSIRPLDREALDVLAEILTGRNDTVGLRELWREELFSQEEVRPDKRDDERIAWLRKAIAESALDAGLHQEALDIAFRILDGGRYEASCLDTVVRVYKETLDPVFFTAVANLLDRHSENMRLLDLYRFVAGKDGVEPGAEYCLRHAIEIEETLELDDLRFEDLNRLIFLLPDDPDVRRNFEATGRRIGRVPDVVATFEKVFLGNQDKPVAYELALALALILEKEMGRPEDAASYLRVAFLRRPDDQKVVNRLADIYESLGRFNELALLYENLGDLADDPRERIAHYFKAYEVVRHSVEDAEGAAEILKKVLDSDPDNAIAIESIEAIYRETENFQELVVWIRRKSEIADGQSDRRLLMLELAEILGDRLDRRADAITVLEAMLEEYPQDDDVWTLLERNSLESGVFEDIADMYVRKAAQMKALPEQLAALKKAASVYEGQIGDRFAAMEVLRSILKADPADKYAFVRLSELLDSSGDFESLVEMLKARMAVTLVSADLVELNTQIGEVWDVKLGNPAEAITHYRAALDLDPYTDRAAAGLERLMDEGSQSKEAAHILEKVYEAIGEYQKLVAVLRRESEMPGDTAARTPVLVKMAEVTLRMLDRPAEAMSILGEALRDDPSSDEILKHIQVIAGDKGLWSTAYEIVAPVADAAIDTDVAMKLHSFAGNMAADALSNPALAARHFTAYLSMSADDAEVLGRLEDAYVQLNRKEDQSRVLRRRIGLAGDDAGADMRLRLAAILMEDATDIEGAFEQVRTVLVSDPANPEAIRLMSNLSAEPIVGRHAMDALRRAFSDSRDDSGLLWAVESQIERSHETSDLLELHNQAAAAAARLGKAGLELSHLGKALCLDPSDDNLLDRILIAAGTSGDGRQAWNIMRMAAQAASWPDLEKKLLLTGVKLASELGHEAAAETEVALRRVLEIDPSSREALEALDNEYSNAGRIEDLVKVLRHRLRLDLGVSERIDVLIRIAGLLETRREFKAAAEAFEEASSLGAGDLDTLKRLRRCYEQLDDVQGQVDTIERMSSATPDVAGRLALLLEVASLQETVLHDLPAARATLERVVSLDPVGTTARRRLESIYEQLEEYESLVRILGYAIDSDLPLEERVRSALKATAIAENRLENMTVALGFARKAAQIDPGAPTVIDELLRLYYKSEDWTSLISIVRRKAQSEGDVNEKVLLLARACDIARDKLGDQSLAGTIAREILAVNANHPEALLTLARMMESKDQDTEALKLYRRLQEAAIDDNHRIEALLGTARILMKRGENGEEVRTALQEAAAINPKHPAVNNFLKRVYTERGDFAKVVEVLLRDLKNTESDEERAGICMDIAEIYMKKLNQGDKFIQYAEEAHRYRKDDPRVVAGIVKFYLRTGDEQKAVPYLEWLVNYLEAKRRLRELPPYAHELGRILEASGDLTRAVEYYRICHEHDASNITNTLALARLHVRNRDMEKAMRVLQPLLLRIDAIEPEQKKEVLLSIAGIHESRGDLKKARQFVTRLLSDQPDSREAREFLSRL